MGRRLDPDRGPVSVPMAFSSSGRPLKDLYVDGTKCAKLTAQVLACDEAPRIADSYFLQYFRQLSLQTERRLMLSTCSQQCKNRFSAACGEP